MEYIPQSTLDKNFVYTLNIKENAQENILEPTLNFTNGSKTISVRLYIEEKYKSFEDALPVYKYDENSEEGTYVEKNSLFVITVKRPVDTYKKLLSDHYNDYSNDVEISNSKAVLVDAEYNYCFNDIDCIDDVTFKFFIKNVKSEEELPKIVLYNVYDGKDFTTKEITLKLKTVKCSVKGYKCCDNVKHTVRSTDKDGDWAIENGEWCLIRDNKGMDTTPKLISICESYSENEAYSYPCCDRLSLTSVQDLGYNRYLGKEDAFQCGVHRCVYTGEYPVCKKTTKVKYTDDTLKWGVENGNWCVLCL